MHNLAFIDGQNLYLGTKSSGWVLDLQKFRLYLKEKYQIDKAYYFLGQTKKENLDLYIQIQEAGFILLFRDHKENFISNKKGNVDTDIVFEVMKNFAKNKTLNRILLVSNDGDYFRMVKFLIEENKFLKILFPRKENSSSLYKQLTSKYFDSLDSVDVKNKIMKTSEKEKANLGN
jgi:uncharacterized LabA/DUF88 family protein